MSLPPMRLLLESPVIVMPLPRFPRPLVPLTSRPIQFPNTKDRTQRGPFSVTPVPLPLITFPGPIAVSGALSISTPEAWLVRMAVPVAFNPIRFP